MHLDRLVLDQFRTYEHLDLPIPPPGLRITGRNASGKTSVLEALVMLSTTRSPRASSDRDVVRWESGNDYGVPPYARLTADIGGSSGVRSVGIGLELDPAGEVVTRKQFLVNGEQVRAHDLIGVVKGVLFSPEDVLLVAGPPAERRRQFDILLSQIDRGYLRALAQYGKVLAQRNQLLKRFARERRAARDVAAVTEISFWDEQLVSLGAHVIADRRRIALLAGDIVRARSDHLVDRSEMGFAYMPRLALHGLDAEAPADGDRQAIAQQFQAAIEEARIDEFRRGMTVVGPHRDDYQFTIHGRELAQYGSRGQQRLGVIAYRLAEVDIIDRQTGERPVLLLDDVLSELDATHRDMVMAEVAVCGCQILVTSTDASMLEQQPLSALPLVVVEGGALRGT
jgi:DNA replication and repair protein RecF